MNLGKTIKMCRKKRGLKQAELAGLADISVSHLSLLENEDRDPSLSSITSISKSLRIPISVLMLLASQYDEIKEFSEIQIEELSRSIIGIMDATNRQESLF